MTKFNIAFTVLVTLVLAGLLGSPTARSNQNAADAKPVRWEYISEAVDANTVQSKLNEWAAQNWEFVAMVASDRVLETTDKSRLFIEKYQVTARRAVKQ